VTASNASGVNDAAPAVVVMSAGRAKELNPVQARILSYAVCEVEPKTMGANALLTDCDELPAGTSLRLDDNADTRPFNSARLHLAHARRLARQGDIQEARGFLHRARDGFAVCGAPPWRDRAGHELAALAAASR
jgi:hypothetical protein